MVDDTIQRSDDHALRILEAAYGEERDADRGEPLTDEALARMRVAIDHAFEQAWATVRARAAAEVAQAADRRSVARRSFAEWTREQLVARLAELRQLFGGQLQLAHQRLVSLSDDELRSLLADLEDAAARQDASV